MEAAAQQGRFEDAYKLMFETQTKWGEQRDPAGDTFRGFAAQLDLELDAWQTAELL